MPRPFDVLRERLLKAGVAPCHVRRYERELREHLDELKAMQVARGYEGEDVEIRARALLGQDEELAEAMLAHREFRSLSARAPWLVFGVAPFFFVLAALALLALIVVGFSLPVTTPGGTYAAIPDWYRPGAAAICALANFAVGPLLAALYLVLAQRQRMPLLWPKISTLAVATWGALTTFTVRIPVPQVPYSGELSIGLSAGTFAWDHAIRFALTAAVAFAAYLILKNYRRPSVI